MQEGDWHLGSLRHLPVRHKLMTPHGNVAEESSLDDGGFVWPEAAYSDFPEKCFQNTKGTTESICLLSLKSSDPCYGNLVTSCPKHPDWLSSPNSRLSLSGCAT